MSDAITLQGGLLSGDFLERLRQGDAPGCKARHYDVPGRLEDRITSAWNDLQNAWRLFQLQRSRVPEDDEDDAYRVTRDYWLRYLFDALRYGHLTEQAPLRIEGKTYPIRFSFQEVPIQVVAFSQDLDKGPDGTARGNPHSQLQQYVNHPSTPEWGVLTNGLRWRLLRDNAASTRTAYIEFDLEAMMGSGEDGDGQFDVFGLFWRIAHASRITGESPWLEKWMREADRQGIRALEGLRTGVTDAIEILGAGFLKHPKNRDLHDALQSGELSAQEYFHQILRLVYRLLFLFVTEDRGLLLDPDASREAKEAYQAHYGTRRLRRLAREVRGSQHHDLFESLKVVMDGLKSAEGCKPLALPPLNSALWSKEFIPDLDNAHIRNLHLLQAVRKLSRVKVQKQYRNVDYKNLGSEELGGVYESLLELSASVNPTDRQFRLIAAAGNERKTTGSYYTPTEIVDLALDEALDPVLAQAASQENPEDAILALRVCDPTCGSGHFLIGAAHRIAKRLAEVRSGEAEPVAAEVQHALRDVISHCIYGVDINPMSVELCKVSLWLEAMEPGKPLAFLEHRIKVGNAFMGATPKMLEAGIPDEAYKALDLDDADACKQLKKDNRDVVKALSQSTRLSAYLDVQERLGAGIANVDSLPADSVQDIQAKEKAYEDIVLASSEYEQARLALDAICAAWTYIKQPLHRTDKQEIRINNPHITTGTVVEILDGDTANPDVRQLIESERGHPSNRFFHWHLEFPDVFRPDRGPANKLTGWVGGFDAIVGNPPWEKVKLHEKEFFAMYGIDGESAASKNRRRKWIEQLAERRPEVLAAYQRALQITKASSTFMRGGGLYPLCGHGDLNTYALATELATVLIHSRGSVGLVVPTGIAVDDTYRRFFQWVMEKRCLRALFDFENKGLFSAVDDRQHFCVLALTGLDWPINDATFAFYLHAASELNEGRRFSLSADDIRRINPNSLTCPVFRDAQGAELSARIYAQNGVLKPAKGDSWQVQLLQVFHMTNDSSLFHSEDQLLRSDWQRIGLTWTKERTYWPVWEGKMVGMYDHRAADIVFKADNPSRPQQPRANTSEKHESPHFEATPYQWGPADEQCRRTNGVWQQDWYPCIKRVSSATNERTFVGCIVPQGAISYTLYPIVSRHRSPKRVVCLLANLLSIPGDYLVRQKTTQPSLPKGVIEETAVIDQERFRHPCPWSQSESLETWVVNRVLELSFTSWSLMPFARSMGHVGGPFKWDPRRRLYLQAELNAAFAILYGCSRRDLAYMLSTFTTMARYEKSEWGTFLTESLTMQAYDLMSKAIKSGTSYRTLLTPPPADVEQTHSSSSPRPGMVIEATQNRTTHTDHSWRLPPHQARLSF